MISRKKSVVLSAREIAVPLSSSHKGIPSEQVPVPVKRHWGEPGHTRDTLAHGSHRRTSQQTKPTAVRSRPTLIPVKRHRGDRDEYRYSPIHKSPPPAPGRRAVVRVCLWVGMVVTCEKIVHGIVVSRLSLVCPRAIRVSVVPVLVIYIGLRL